MACHVGHELSMHLFQKVVVVVVGGGGGGGGGG